VATFGIAHSNGVDDKARGYRGAKAAFPRSPRVRKEDWPQPIKIAYYDPHGGGADVIRYAHWVPATITRKAS